MIDGKVGGGGERERESAWRRSNGVINTVEGEGEGGRGGGEHLDCITLYSTSEQLNTTHFLVKVLGRPLLTLSYQY